MKDQELIDKEEQKLIDEEKQKLIDEALYKCYKKYNNIDRLYTDLMCDDLHDKMEKFNYINDIDNRDLITAFFYTKYEGKTLFEYMFLNMSDDEKIDFYRDVIIAKIKNRVNDYAFKILSVKCFQNSNDLFRKGMINHFKKRVQGSDFQKIFVTSYFNISDFPNESKDLELIKIFVILQTASYFEVDYDETIKPYEEKLLHSNDLGIIYCLAKITPNLEVIAECEDIIVRSNSTEYMLKYAELKNVLKAFSKLERAIINTKDSNSIFEFFKIYKKKKNVNFDNIFNYFEAIEDSDMMKKFYDFILDDKTLVYNYFVKNDGKYNIERFNNMFNFYIEKGQIYECYPLCFRYLEKDQIIKNLQEKTDEEMNNHIKKKDYSRNFTYQANYNFIVEEYMCLDVSTITEKEFQNLVDLSINNSFVSPKLILDYLKINFSDEELEKHKIDYLEKLKKNKIKYIYYKEAFDKNITFEQADLFYQDFIKEKYAEVLVEERISMLDDPDTEFYSPGSRLLNKKRR